MKITELFDLYHAYVKDNTESPFVYHRWSLIGCLSTAISRRVTFPLGHFTIYPNQYIQIIGNSGIRKSSAISIPIGLMRDAGYDSFAPKSTTKEAFMSKLAGRGDELAGVEVSEEDPFKFEAPNAGISEILIAADEFNAFIGSNHEDFLTLLSELWDCPPDWDKWLMSRDMPVVQKPCVNIISGNTPTGFLARFSGVNLGQGILTRFIVVPWNERGEKLSLIHI